MSLAIDIAIAEIEEAADGLIECTTAEEALRWNDRCVEIGAILKVVEGDKDIARLAAAFRRNTEKLEAKLELMKRISG